MTCQHWNNGGGKKKIQLGKWLFQGWLCRETVLRTFKISSNIRFYSETVEKTKMFVQRIEIWVSRWSERYTIMSPHVITCKMNGCTTKTKALSDLCICSADCVHVKYKDACVVALHICFRLEKAGSGSLAGGPAAIAALHGCSISPFGHKPRSEIPLCPLRAHDWWTLPASVRISGDWVEVRSWYAAAFSSRAWLKSKGFDKI